LQEESFQTAFPQVLKFVIRCTMEAHFLQRQIRGLLRLEKMRFGDFCGRLRFETSNNSMPKILNNQQLQSEIFLLMRRNLFL
jgi:hypothetical protein